MKKLFAKPKNRIYAALLAIVLFFAVKPLVTPDAAAKNLGEVKPGAVNSCDGFQFSARMTPVSATDTEGTVEVTFDDTADVSKDILVSAQYRSMALKQVAVSYSYTLNGTSYRQDLPDAELQFDIGKIGGAAFPQPFPRGAKERKLTFRQTAQTTDGLEAEGFIAVGSTLQHCELTAGVLTSVDQQKAWHFGGVQLVRFTFRAEQ